MSLICFVFSAGANDVCNLLSSSADEKIKIEGVPGYFFKVHPDGGYVSFIEFGHNTLLDLKSGKEFPMPGTIDPVWSPDGKFLTHPDGAYKSLQFYWGNDLIERTKSGTYKNLEHFDSDLGGVYQSIGLQGGKYKIISDANGASIGTFEFSSDGPKLVTAIKKPCENISNFPTDLPMISKDGKYLSVFDSSNKSTKIYQLKDSQCELALDLGFGTGKVSFNSDSSQIAFHVDQFSTFEEGYFSGVSKDKVKNVVVLNLDQTSSGKLIPSTWAMASQHTIPGDGGYYPDFDKNGSLYFMEDINNNFQIVKVSPKSLEFRQTEEGLLFNKVNCANCGAQQTKPIPSIVLSKMWMSVCANQNTTALDQHPELALSIHPEECKKMVKEFWLPTLEVSLDELLKSCPQKMPKTPNEIGQWDLNQTQKIETLIQGKCIICHSASKEFESKKTMKVWTGDDQWENQVITFKKKLPAINLEHLDRRMISRMFSSIASGQMPKGNPFKEKEQKMILDYLSKKELDLKPQNVYNITSFNRFTEKNLELKRNEALSKLPESSDEISKRNTILMVNCFYGQKDCGEYLESHRGKIEAAASILPIEQRNKYIENEFLRLRCENLFEVTPQQCIDYKESKDQN